MGYISFRSTCSSKNGTFFVATCLAKKLQIFHNEKRKRKERDLILILPQNSIRYILFLPIIHSTNIFNGEKLFFQETE